jgi:peptidoglycan biosynthesis protein MviN/MurJ (putative lipid II flippase)
VLLSGPISHCSFDFFKVKNKLGYNRTRLTVIVCIMAANFSGAVVSALHRHYPIGVAPVLFLIPCLLRELDLRSGRRLRRLGPFEWSCFIGGFLFLAVLPFLIA